MPAVRPCLLKRSAAEPDQRLFALCKKWNEYETAVCDMVDRTSTEIAPWTLVEANDKNFARVKILKTLCRQIEAAMKNYK